MSYLVKPILNWFFLAVDENLVIDKILAEDKSLVVDKMPSTLDPYFFWM